MTMTDDRRILAALQAERLKRAAEHSLRAFVEQAWTILEPTTPFLPSWHIDLLCETLEAVSAAEIPRLVINLPPRYMKSLLVTVLWPLSPTRNVTHALRIGAGRRPPVCPGPGCPP